MTIPKAIFIHIPKTGGTSIRSVLWPGTPNDHRMAREHQRGDWERAFTFAFVRCPYERLASSYCYHRSPRYRGKWPNADRRTMTLRDYLRLAMEPPTYLTPSFRPMTAFVDHPLSGQPIDFIGRFETLPRDAARVLRRLGVSVALPHRNGNAAPDYNAILGPRERELIRDMYADDFGRFGYGA